MDKAQAEPQKPVEPVTAAAPNGEPASKPHEETPKPAVTTDDQGAKKETDEPAAAPAAASAPQEVSNDDTKVIKQESQDAAKPADTPATENKASGDVAEETKPSFLAKNPALGKLFDRLPSILEKAGHSEMWGVTLKDASDPPTANVVIKFLRANEGDTKLAEEQLSKALEWRKKMDPLTLADKARFNRTKFGGLGYVTTYDQPNAGEGVFTWNIYGAVKDINGTFGDVDEFIKWRVALMELAIQELKLNEATAVIDYDGEDPYQMIQVHDYQNVSFLRMNPTIRAASRTTIEVFSMAYPELLKEKFFVNVPAIMGWMFAAMKVFLSKNTTRKFHPIANGANLAKEFSNFGEKIPKAYGGKGAELQDNATTVALEDAAPEPTPETAPAPEESSTPAPRDTAATDTSDKK